MTDRILAREVRPGDVLDLEGDTYADPTGDGLDHHGTDFNGGDPTYTAFEFELAEVESVKWEGSNCVVIYTSLANFGCPPDHVLKRERHDAELAAQLREIPS